MKQDNKLKFLGDKSETELTKNVLMRLYGPEGMNMSCVEFRCGSKRGGGEQGCDLTYSKTDEYNKTRWVGVQTKKGKILKSNVGEITSQLTQATGAEFKTQKDNQKFKLYEIVLITSGSITHEAERALHDHAKALNFGDKFTIINGDALVDLIDRCLPKIYSGDDDGFAKYFTEMKTEFEKIKDVSALGQREAIPLDEIYVKLKLTEEESKYHKRIEKDFIISIPEYEKKQDTRKTGEPQTQIMDEDQAVKDYKHLIIVGPPGSGKTTLLKYLALKACKENLREQERISIPIYVNIREFSDDGSTLEEYLIKVFEKFKFPKAEKQIEEDLKAGKCKLLLDGFDELATKTRQDKVAKEILGFAGKHRNCQVIASSRIAGYHNELTGFTKLELVEFDDRQIEDFTTNWFRKTNPELGKAMLKEIKKSQNIKRLARNPLMITIIAIIYEEEKQLPHRRSELYERCVDVLLSRWDKERKIKNIFKPDDKKLFLRLLALHGHKNDKKIFAKKDVRTIWDKNYKRFTNVNKKDFTKFLTEIWERSHLLRPISRNTYDFLHLSFQEYFTALELTKESESGLKTICRFVDKHWWEEPILLYAGILNDASDLINAIEENVPEDIFHSNLLLFGKCIADAPQTDAKLRDSVNADLWRLYTKKEFHLHAEKALGIFAYAKPQKIIDRFIKRLNSAQADTRAEAALSLGRIGGDKTVDALINALKDKYKDSYVRENAASALGKIGGDKAVDALINALKLDKNSSVRGRVAYALGGIGGEKAQKQLISALKQDKGTYVRWRVAFALGNIGGDKAVEPLINALKLDKHSYVRGYAASALGRIGGEEAVEPLINALKQDKYISVRRRVAYSLGKIGDEKAVIPLINALEDKESLVRWSAAEALGKIKGEKDVIRCLTALKDEDRYVRRRAAETLGGIGGEKAVEPLIHALKDEDSLVRVSAAEALGKFGGEKAVKPLINKLKDRSRDVRRSAAEALGKIGGEKAVRPILKILNDRGAKNWRSYKDDAFQALYKICRRTGIRINLERLKTKQ